MGTKLVGDHLSMGTKFLGTICPLGLNWLGTVCPEGPINWGPIVGDHMHLGPNASQPRFYMLISGQFIANYLNLRSKLLFVCFEKLNFSDF